MSSSTDQSRIPYRGRFAPSPTGPLHFGSLVTALGSYLQAKSQGGEWLVRMENIDPPREVPGAADDILRTLEAFHLYWDGQVLYQSHRTEAYLAALDELTRLGHTFACACTRKSIADAMSKTASDTKNNGGVYPGTCRHGLPPGKQARSIRLRVKPQTITFEDHLQGGIEIQLDRDVGDFVIKRADGYYAYHLAVVIDDAHQGISEIVRGTDLMASTPHHLYLQQLMDYHTPRYAHLPIAINRQGEKLSKQTHAAPVDTGSIVPTLVKALEYLGHPPEPAVITEGPDELLLWALSQWNLGRVPKTRAITVES